MSASDETNSTNNRPKSLIGKLKSKIAPKNSGGPAGKSNRNQALMIGLAVLFIGVMFYPDEPTPEVAAPAEVKKIAKADPRPAETPSADAPKAEDPIDPTAAVNPDTPVDSTATPTDPTAIDPTTTSAETTAETPSEPPADPTATVPTTEPAPESTPVPEESSLSDLLPPEEAPTAPPSAPPASVDSVDGDVAIDDTTTTDKILDDLEKQVKKEQPREVKKEYVSPPDYEYKGRGLVYNCAGKHWACVDAPSYKSCEDNHSSVTFLRKTVECYPFNVYQTPKGCEAMQNRVVSTNAKTNFCKGN